MESILTKAIATAQQSNISFSKFITANDTGATGGHQSGFHIHKIHGIYFLIAKVKEA
ncbi:MAG: hypothetical protein IPH46_17355 [Bacteroidetes bacterium]|nr:hypothetical protein [Bacteroidota bacterium]